MALTGCLAIFGSALVMAQDAPPVRWHDRIEIASGGGYQGPWRMNESVYRYVDDPTVAITRSDAIGLAWVDQTEKDVFFQRLTFGGEAQLPEPVNVSHSPNILSWLPRIVITDADPSAVFVLWQEIVFSGGSHGGEIFFARSTDGGRQFSAPRNLSNDMAGSGKGRLTKDYWHNGSLDLAQGPDGILYTAWTDYEGRLWLSRSTDGGERFSKPVRVAGEETRPARGPSLAVDAAGDVYLVWTVGEDPAANVHISVSTDRGRSFAPARTAVETTGHADAPKIAVDSDGTLHLVFAHSPLGPFRRYHIAYSRSVDGGRSFQQPKTIAHPQTEGIESVSFPALALDGADNLYVLWELFPTLGGRPRGLGFTYSDDRGQGFAAPSVVPGSREPGLGANGSLQGLLMQKLAVNPAGAIAVVNSTFKANEASHVWLFPARSHLD